MAFFYAAAPAYDRALPSEMFMPGNWLMTTFNWESF